MADADQIRSRRIQYETEGLDLAGYPIVDISLEPLDGDPVHSKVSLARGELRV